MPPRFAMCDFPLRMCISSLLQCAACGFKAHPCPQVALKAGRGALKQKGQARALRSEAARVIRSASIRPAAPQRVDQYHARPSGSMFLGGPIWGGRCWPACMPEGRACAKAGRNRAGPCGQAQAPSICGCGHTPGLEAATSGVSWRWHRGVAQGQALQSAGPSGSSGAGLAKRWPRGRPCKRSDMCASRFIRQRGFPAGACLRTRRFRQQAECSGARRRRIQ